MGNCLITSTLQKGHNKALWVLLWRSVESVIQRIRVLVVLLPLLGYMKHLLQPRCGRFYIKFIIPAVLIGLADISLARNTNYNRQRPPVRYINSTGSRSNVLTSIKNPYNAQDYMSRLAEKLPPEQRDLLLRGQDLNKGISIEPKRAWSATGMRGEEPLFTTEEAWSLTEDLDKYRAYAVKEGSREPLENLKKMLAHAGFFVEDGINIFTLGYGSDRAIPFRANDGNSPLWHAKTVAEQGRQTLAEFTDGVYSVIDLMTFDSLADIQKEIYKDNHPAVRPLVFTGRTIGGTWKTTESIANMLTWGYFDNFSGSAAMCVGDIVESLKHGGQAVTNLPREIVYLTVGMDEDADKTLDWILIVPWELASNIIEMQGISNMQDYKTAFKDKGVVGSILELTGATVITYLTIDELIDDDDNNKHTEGGASTTPPGGGGSGGNGGNGSNGSNGSDDSTYIFWMPW